MKRIVTVFAVLGFVVFNMASVADAAKAAEDLKREAQTAANSNSVDTTRPQLGVNTNVGPEVPMVEETKPPAAPVAQGAPLAARPRNTMWMILAVLAVLLGSQFLKRLRSRSGPS
jgi:hypothetical protein